jgi:hypothetical protein
MNSFFHFHTAVQPAVSPSVASTPQVICCKHDSGDPLSTQTHTFSTCFPSKFWKIHLIVLGSRARDEKLPIPQ